MQSLLRCHRKYCLGQAHSPLAQLTAVRARAAASACSCSSIATTASSTQSKTEFTSMLLSMLGNWSHATRCMFLRACTSVATLPRCTARLLADSVPPKTFHMRSTGVQDYIIHTSGQQFQFNCTTWYVVAICAPSSYIYMSP
jgi:hypothetical protein